MRAYLDRERTLRLVHAIHGGTDGLTGAWEEMRKANKDFPRPRQRAAIYRWIADGLPNRRRLWRPKAPDDGGLEVIGLCALLNVDPLSILDFRRSGYFSSFSKLRQLVYLGAGALGGLSPIFDLLRPGDEWPSDSIARKCYGRTWFAHQFSNLEDWTSENYILVKAMFSEKIAESPRAVHIAYRRTTGTDSMWRYYGTVLSVDGNLHLYNEGGAYQQMPVVEDDEIRFRTYFGGRAVEWRVASIHQFEFSTEYPFNDISTIGFNW